jgi:bifunctional UDP-N-acetylglucosamine pyrophosphorylase/glucosamine-1-phosphate N-acetyltransferase
MPEKHFLKDKKKRLEILALLEKGGVKIIDPENTYIDETVKIGKGTVVYPFVAIVANTVIGENCLIWWFNTIIESEIGNRVNIGSFCKIEGCIIEDGARIRSHSALTASKIGTKCRVGPMAKLLQKHIT